jgi:hypothetical protein
MNRRKFLISSAVMAGGAKLSFPSQGSRGPTLAVGDDRLHVVLDYGARGLRETSYKVENRSLVDLSGEAWSIQLDGTTISSVQSAVSLVHKEGSPLSRSAVFRGEATQITWELTYSVSGPGRITKSLRLFPKLAGILSTVTLWNAQSTIKPQIVRTKIQDIAAFYRGQDVGLFTSLDFPYSKIVSVAGATHVSYPPYDVLKAGSVYSPHSLTFGAVRLTGKQNYGCYEGEVEAMDAYVQEHRKPRFERPMYLSASIVNRYTQVNDGIIFYTQRDQPLFSANTDLVKRDLDLMAKLGMEYYQAFPGVFEWAPEDTKSEVDKLVSFAHKRGLRIGDYSATSYVYSPHFNFYRNTLNRPDWFIREKDGKQKNVYCFGNPDFTHMYTEKVVESCRRFQFDLHCLDLLSFSPCYASNHAHPPGTESYYHQIRGLMGIIEAINALSPQMITWPNSGDFTEMLPKLAWYSPNLYLTDPSIAKPWQGLNMTRLLDDARREQMVSLHQSLFVPYRFFTNFQYFLGQSSIVPDIRNFEFGALSTLAVTPNLGLGEIRPWIERLSPSDHDKVTSFYSRWTKLVERNYNLWTKTYQAGENPGMGAVEIYGHAAGDHGFIFLINPNYWDRTVEVPLDKTLGFTGTGNCEITEIYPTEFLRLTAQGPWPAFGTRLPMNVPAQQVVVLEVRQAPNAFEAPRVYGLPGTIEFVDGGYLFKTSAPQGQAARFAVMLPKRSRSVTEAKVLDYPKEIDPRLSEPTKIELLSSVANGALLKATFRRKSAPTELPAWRVKSGSLENGIAAKWHMSLGEGELIRFPLFNDTEIVLPMTDDDAARLGLGPVANFCGAYVDHAFSEMQETWIELHHGTQAGLSVVPLTTEETLPSRKSLPALAKTSEKAWWFETSVDIPFLHSLGFDPAFDEHTIIVFPLLRQKNTKVFAAWVNGKELNVQSYAYPNNHNLACYYADLNGSSAHGGHNTLVVHLAC